VPEYLHHLLTSPWILAIVFVVAALDAIVPMSPSEGTVIAVAVAAATTGTPHPALLIAVAAAGAYAGDRTAYHIGNRRGTSAIARLQRNKRGQAAYVWTRRLLHRRGAAVLMFARYLPLGRSASTLAAGATGYPLARFRLWTAAGVTVWAGFATATGHWGGTAFESEPWKGMLVAYAAIAAVLAVAEGIRRLHQRSSKHRIPSA
jgi:membrane protein DedA with SNARE-associated domain